MNPEERENMISILAWFLGWNTSTFERMTDEEIERVYRERVEGHE
ncbi:BH0509 family protein [Fictibacillus gelatini]|nr:BH0509 family protein [Fictibacillus gelatini]